MVNNSKKSTTGIKKIKRKNGYKYQAGISITGKYHHLDNFDNFNYAYKFRQEALEKLRPKEKTHYVKKSSLIDLTGQKFGYLTALSKLPYDSRNNSRWLCKCDCGNKPRLFLVL